MPRGDRTGPVGHGPMTGRGLGYCAGYNSPGFVKSGYGRRAGGWGYGRGFGRGLGRGYGRGYGFGPGYGRYVPVQAQYDSRDELRFLEDQAQLLKEELDSVKERINELKGHDTKNDEE
ncbi:DUF5320 domain-containing protein [Halothermothrix orenii]|uniref:DUF5320 domain-containing protein n=1 Tax=Halothermothrix orenii (strain H 168 / OCM 544 / DSM 9562) TaxID=373903 RepID=B8CZ61_HALOH|nr:DUF5320 domain-containing protein [Halothermothrix orenii]ACL70580.1 hypothetical protein Hore_18310 [Halothermothrix orenii H 168]